MRDIVNELYMRAPPLPHFLTAGKVLFTPGMAHVERSRIGVFDLIVLARGELYIGEAGADLSAKAGQALVLRPDRHHYSIKPCERETLFYWMHFQTGATWSDTPEPASAIAASTGIEPELGDLTPTGSRYTIRLPQLLTLSQPEKTYADAESLLMLAGSPDLVGCWQQQSLFHRLLLRLCGDARMTRPHSATVELAERTAAYLNRHFAETITNERLHAELHYHPIYITRCMRAVFGCTPHEYVMEKRIAQAKLLLLTTDKLVSAICAEVGFDDPPYFTRRFKTEVGVGPKAYRQQFVARSSSAAEGSEW